jgi:hypothetical protein
MRGKVVGVDSADLGTGDRTGYSVAVASLEGISLKAAWTARSMPLWCPFCGKPHVDRGEYATRPHHKHLCHDDEHGKGCGKLFRVGEKESAEYVFGAEREHAAIHVLVDQAREQTHEAIEQAARGGRYPDGLQMVDIAFARLRRALRGAP